MVHGLLAKLSRATVSGRGCRDPFLKLPSLNEMGSMRFFFLHGSTERSRQVMRVNESQDPNCVLGGKFQDFLVI